MHCHLPCWACVCLVATRPPVRGAGRPCPRQLRQEIHSQYASAAEAFAAFDVDQDGVLSPGEFEEALRGRCAMGFLTRLEVHALMARCDMSMRGVPQQSCGAGMGDVGNGCLGRAQWEGRQSSGVGWQPPS